MTNIALQFHLQYHQKVISNRLNPPMTQLNSIEQMGYVEGQNILDGIIMKHEFIHSLETTKKPSILLKLNM